MLDDFSFSPEDASRRDLKRDRGRRQARKAAATQWTNAHLSLFLSLSLNLVINYEREIIINICLPGVRPPSDRPTFNAHFLWADLD